MDSSPDSKAALKLAEEDRAEVIQAWHQGHDWLRALEQDPTDPCLCPRCEDPAGYRADLQAANMALDEAGTEVFGPDEWRRMTVNRRTNLDDLPRAERPAIPLTPIQLKLMHQARIVNETLRRLHPEGGAKERTGYQRYFRPEEIARLGYRT